MASSGIFLGAVDIRQFPPTGSDLNVNIDQVAGVAPDLASETTLASVAAKTAQLTFDGDSALQVVEPIANEAVFYDGAPTTDRSAGIIFSTGAKLLTIQGTCSVGITITLQFYSALKATYYTSQYQYVVPAGGADFAFAIPACPKGVQLLLTAAESTGTITATLAYC